MTFFCLKDFLECDAPSIDLVSTNLLFKWEFGM